MKELVKGLLWLGLVLLIIGGVIWFISSVFSGIGGLGKYEGQTAEEWFNQYEEASGQVEKLKTALQEANDNIEEANSDIDSAKSYEGASYDDMVNALNSLDTVSTVDEP